MQEGVYAEKRDLIYGCDRIIKQHDIVANIIQRLSTIPFPEYARLYTRFDAITRIEAVFNSVGLDEGR